MEREQVLRELNLRVLNKNIIQHSLAVEAIMRAFGRHFKDDEGKWGLTGLIHDIDYEKCSDPAQRHGQICEEILEGLGADDFIIYAIKAHNNNNHFERKRKLDKVLFSANAVAILLMDAVKLLPSKSLNDLTVPFVLEKMKDKEFSKETNRDDIKVCTELGLKFEEFIQIALQGIKISEKDIFQ
jgi:putative nucleotidyltransferase with HDIG domain